MFWLKGFQVENIIAATKLALVHHSLDAQSYFSAVSFLLTFEACLHNYERAVHEENVSPVVGVQEQNEYVTIITHISSI